MIFQEWYQIPEKVQPEAEPQEKQTGGLLYRDWWLCNTKFSQVKEIGNFSWKIEVKAVSEWLSHGWRNFTYLTTKKTIGSGSFWECAKGPNGRRGRPGQEAGRSEMQWGSSESAGSQTYEFSFPSSFLGARTGARAWGYKDSQFMAPHFKKGPVNKIKQYQEAEGDGARKGHWFATPWDCDSVAQWEGWEGSPPAGG